MFGSKGREMLETTRKGTSPGFHLGGGGCHGFSGPLCSCSFDLLICSRISLKGIWLSSKAAAAGKASWDSAGISGPACHGFAASVR